MSGCFLDRLTSRCGRSVGVAASVYAHGYSIQRKVSGVRLSLTPGSLEITANNPEQEQAEESVPVDYAGDALEVGFNVSYLLDVMGVLTGATVRMSLSDSASSALIEEGEAGGDTDAEALYVVMPMRL